MNFSKTVSVLACGVVCWFILAIQPADAQTRRGAANRALRNIQKDNEAALKQLQQTQEELGKATKELAKAQLDYKRAQAEVEQARKTLSDRVGPKVGLPDAMSRLTAAQSEYETAAAKRAGELRTDEGFQQLKQKMMETEARMEALKTEQTTTKKDILAAAAKESLRAREAYQNRLDQDAYVQPHREKLSAAEDRLKQVRVKLNQLTKNDPELHQSDASFKQAKKGLEQAQATVAGLEQRIALLQDRLAANQTLLGR